MMSKCSVLKACIQLVRFRHGQDAHCYIRHTNFAILQTPVSWKGLDAYECTQVHEFKSCVQGQVRRSLALNYRRQSLTELPLKIRRLFQMRRHDPPLLFVVLPFYIENGVIH
jgi:hypothetical protein